MRPARTRAAPTSMTPLHVQRALPLGLAAILIPVAACRAPEAYRAEADEEVYALIAARRAAFVADPASFTIEPPAASLRARALAGEFMSLGPLGLLESMEIAAENNRGYQGRRESLYLAALDLTLEQWRFSVKDSASAGAFADGTGDDGDSWVASGDLGLSKLFGTGALVVANLGISTLKLVGSGADPNEVTNASLSITQPLLRGFGVNIVMDPLTQAERSLLYEVRAYERFRRNFAVDVADRYFRVLQQYDTVANQVRNAERLALVAARNEAFAEAGQLNEIDRDEAVQDKLDADNAVVEAHQQLEFLLDDFNLFLGLPVELSITLDQGELIQMREVGLDVVSYDSEASVAYALEHRLDHLTVLDRVTDAERDLLLAVDALRPGLTLAAGASSTSTGDTPFDHGGEAIDWNLDLVLDLPIDQIPERNSYRASLIGLDSARRSAEESTDQISAGVRDALRDLVALRQSHEILTISRDLARRRVESTNMNFDAGRAETRDILVAQSSLVNAENAETRALVDHYLASLALWRDLEILRVDKDGFTVGEMSLDVTEDGG